MSRDRIKNRLQVLLGALLLVPALTSCNPEATGEPQETQYAPPPGVVTLPAKSIENAKIRVEQSRQIELQVHLETTGAVAPDESRVAHIRPLSRGVIEKVYVRRGDRVRAGDPLVLYDNIELGELIGEYTSQEALLQRALAQLEVAAKFLERGKHLLEAEAIAKREVELREAQYKNAQAMVNSRRAELAKVEEKLHRHGLSDPGIAQLGDLGHSGDHRTASHNTLSAPFSGIITEYDVAEGELVGPDRELLTLADVSSVWVLADVYQKDLGRISTGRSVEIFSSTYPGRVFKGKLTYISDVLERGTRTARVRCVVPNRDGALKLEMFVTVKIPSIHRTRAVAIPETAIQTIEGQTVIFTVEKPGQFRKLPVKTGLRADGWVEIENLQEGTDVVTQGSFYLKSAFQRKAIGEDND